MRILVVGGSGFIGTALCRELLQRGHEVTALSRDPRESSLPTKVEMVPGDVTEFNSIQAAFEEQDAVVNLVALSPLFRPRGGNERHYTVHRDGTQNVVRAAEDHGVRKLVQMSALDADSTSDIAHLRAKGLAESIVQSSDLEWVIFRPSVVFGDGGEFVSYTKLLAPPYLTPLPGGGRTRFQPIWVGDLVPMLADAAEGRPSTPTDGEAEDPHVDEIYEIGGPEVLTLADVATLAHAADGKPVRVLPIPMSLARIGLSSLDHVPASVLDALPGVPRMGADQYRSLQVDNTTTANDLDAFGVSSDDLTTLAAYLEVDPDVLDDGEDGPDTAE